MNEVVVPQKKEDSKNKEIQEGILASDWIEKRTNFVN